MTAAQGLANFAASLAGRSIPDAAQAAVKRHFLDAIGCALAAAGTGASAAAVDAVRAWAGTREAVIIGADTEVPAAAAAFANGVLIHALDFDDTHIESVVHPSSVVVAAALAVGEETGANGKDVIAACVIGYEIAARIGAAAPGRFNARGFHPTGIVGPFAAAAVASRLWGLEADEIGSALGLAGSQSSGLFATHSEGAETTRLQPGWAAHAGVIAADLARRGVTGPSGVLDGVNGLFGAHLAGERVDAARVTRGLGYEWETLRIAIKPYPASHFVHAFMDAVKMLGIRPGDVEEVVCHVAPQVLGIVAEPHTTKIRPRSAAAARASLPYCVAAMFFGARDGIELFDDEARSDRRVLALAERVRAVADASLPFPQTYGGRMTVLLRDGRERHIEELVNRGHPDRPLRNSEVRAKFFANARRRLDDSAADKLMDAIDHLDELDSIHEIAALAQGT
ncbi:MAG: MmgE/PrpD family protein [Actinomycetota bacterium]|nr:MmgE/PrpD family protein [Actinomycetota bacterium]